MSKYEQVVEEVAHCVCSICGDDCMVCLLAKEKPFTCRFAFEHANKILSNPSIGILDDDQSLPQNPFYKPETLVGQNEKYSSYSQAQIDMYNNNWRKLVEEK